MSGAGNLARRLARAALRTLLLVVVPAVAVVLGLQQWAKGGRYVETENAYVKANIVAVSTDVDGPVVAVSVRDNQRVAAGDPLFRIDPEPYRLAVAEAEAELDVVRTEIESRRVDYRESLVQTAEARERVRFLGRQLERQEKLRARKLGSQEAYDEARHRVALARQQVRLLEERTRRALAALGGDPEIPVERHPRYLKALARRDRAARDLARTEIRAPSAGVVSNMKLQVGEHVEAGDPVFSLIETEPVWIEANLKETQLTHVREGLRATFVVDAYPDREWSARVETIAPATGSEFALLPPQNASGNWVKVVQRIPVHLAIEAEPDAPALRAGMTVTVSIDTERRREMPAFARRLLDEYEVPGFLRGALRQALALDAHPG